MDDGWTALKERNAWPAYPEGWNAPEPPLSEPLAKLLHAYVPSDAERVFCCGDVVKAVRCLAKWADNAQLVVVVPPEKFIHAQAALFPLRERVTLVAETDPQRTIDDLGRADWTPDAAVFRRELPDVPLAMNVVTAIQTWPGVAVIGEPPFELLELVAAKNYQNLDYDGDAWAMTRQGG